MAIFSKKRKSSPTPVSPRLPNAEELVERAKGRTVEEIIRKLTEGPSEDVVKLALGKLKELGTLPENAVDAGRLSYTLLTRAEKLLSKEELDFVRQRAGYSLSAELADYGIYDY